MTMSVSTFSRIFWMPFSACTAAPATLEAERAGDDADGERADGLGDLGDDRARRRCRCRHPRRR